MSPCPHNRPAPGRRVRTPRQSQFKQRQNDDSGAPQHCSRGR
jgi:hypothetical protein